jgi:DeoR/GlpR family transcriptional regulator of sugar metabolism
MTTTPRTQYILSSLRDRGTLTVAELSTQLGVSLPTIRKDVRLLAEQQLVLRQHGKISLPPAASTQPYQPYDARRVAQIDGKRAIAQVAVSMIRHDDTIILDAGTTALEIANALRGHPRVSIATNSVSVPNVLSDSDHLISLAGGQMINRSLCTAGSEAEAFFRSIHAEKAFIGISGVWDDLRLTTGLKAEAPVKSAMIAAAKRVIVVASNEKFYHSQMFGFCEPEKIDAIITTGPTLPDKILHQIERYHIELIYADKQGK